MPINLYLCIPNCDVPLMCSLVKQVRKKGFTPDSRLQNLIQAVVENRGLFGISFSSKLSFFLNNATLGITHSDFFFCKILSKCVNNKNTWNYFSVSSGIFVYIE